MVEFLPSREVALVVFGRSVHWYGILYVVSFGVAIFLLPYLQKWRELRLSRQDWIEVVTWGAVGVLVGGRLGYVLLYNPVYFFHQPGDIFMLWKGGMASHGGFVGVAVALWLYVRYGAPASLRSLGKSEWIVYLRMMDVLMVPIAMGLAFGRVGNVINQELFATPVVQALAILKNLVIAGTCYCYLRYKRSKEGQVVALFLMMYGILRFLIEFMRVQDHSEVLGLTLGQLYTIPIIIVGVALGVYVKLNRRVLTDEWNEK